MDEDYDPTLRNIVGMKFDGDRYLEIDRGRFLAIGDDGEYVISAEPQAIRGKPYGGFNGYRVPLGGGRRGDYRDFVVDHGDTVDHVSVGILLIDDECIWISGDKIRYEGEAVEEDERDDYFPIMVTSFPKQRPHNLSDKQIWDIVKKKALDKLYAFLKRSGRDVDSTNEVEETKGTGTGTRTRSSSSSSRKRIKYICWFGKRHICPLMTSVARKKRRNH